MTMELDYAYIPVDVALQIKEDVMVRAVRVKSAVKEKLSRLYVVKENTNEVESAANKGVSELVDETKEGLTELNNKLNALEVQGKVSVVEKRAVLFTKALVDRIQKVNAKWFSKIEPVASIPVSEPTLGEVPISADWQNMSEPTLEPVIMTTMESEVSLPVNEEVPSVELPAVDTTIENHEVEEPSVEAPTSMDEEAPVVNGQEIETPVSGENIIPTAIENEVPEVKSEEVSNDSEFKLPSFENTTSEQPSTSEISIAQLSGEAVSQDFVPEPKEISMEVEAPVEGKEDHTVSPLSKAEIFGKIQRINNTLKEKNSENETLREKLRIANESNSKLKDKVNGFNDVVKDLNSQVSSLTQSNEQLKERNTELETKYGDRVSKLEAELEALKAQRLEDAANNRQALDDLRAKHADEIANINRENARKIQEVNDSKDRQINAIYQTLSEALGGTYEDEGYSKAA
ncbi:MAG: hypothetical protein Q4C38_01540 [bacterium]|nr:hypothetical protein [bacterium]